MKSEKNKFKEIDSRLDLLTVDEIDTRLSLDPIESEHRFQVLRFPPGIEVMRLMNELEIMVDWRKSSKNFSLAFAFFWNTFIAILAVISLMAGKLMMMFFLIPFLLSGFYLLYVSLGYLFNTSYIVVRKNEVKVTHEPIKFLMQKDKEYHASQISQVFSKREVQGSQNDQPIHAYSVWLKLADGSTQSLVRGFKTLEHARFIEHQIETYIGLDDQKTQEEVPYG